MTVTHLNSGASEKVQNEIKFLEYLFVPSLFSRSPQEMIFL